MRSPIAPVRERLHPERVDRENAGKAPSKKREVTVGAPPHHLPRPRPQVLKVLRQLKRWLVGTPMPTDDLVHERLGKPTALAVFASDNLSSSAYASEEILRVLVGVVGAAAFALVVPITVGLLAVLGILLFHIGKRSRPIPRRAARTWSRETTLASFPLRSPASRC